MECLFLCMQMYFGYDLDEAPVAGKIWYPKDEKNWSFDMEHVKEIQIRFSGEQDGNIQLDDIGFVH